MRLVECGFFDGLRIMKFCRMGHNKWAQAELRMMQARRLEERMRSAEENSEVVCLARTRDGLLMAECASLTAAVQHAKAECDTMAARIWELEFAGATCIGGFGVVMWAVQSLNARVGTVKARAYVGGLGFLGVRTDVRTLSTCQRAD